VLPVGGIKEKALAAHRAGIKTIILPRRNERDVEDVPLELRQELSFVFVDEAHAVLERALRPLRAPDAGRTSPAKGPEEEIGWEQDEVGEASEESFPASDAPGWTSAHI
jgi:predicted ATP-dependent protease